MLYVNEIRNNAKIARARLRLAISDSANILTDASNPGRMALSTVGVEAVTKIMSDIRGNVDVLFVFNTSSGTEREKLWKEYK
jgi:hypothetical protein